MLFKTHHLPPLIIIQNVQQAETISLLRRELSQSRDQTTNWQDHFLRVEQQRCTLTSRLDELASERRPPPPVIIHTTAPTRFTHYHSLDPPLDARFAIRRASSPTTENSRQVEATDINTCAQAIHNTQYPRGTDYTDSAACANQTCSPRQGDV